VIVTDAAFAVSVDTVVSGTVGFETDSVAVDLAGCLEGKGSTVDAATPAFAGSPDGAFGGETGSSLLVTEIAGTAGAAGRFDPEVVAACTGCTAAIVAGAVTFATPSRSED